MSHIQGKEFVITGKLSGLRSDYIYDIEQNGGRVVGKVKPTTTALIIGQNTRETVKYKDAKKFGVPIIEEHEYEALKGQFW